MSLQDTPYYHCMGRCVRRAWLWGVDPYAGKDYSHRKAWVIERIAYLSEIVRDRYLCLRGDVKSLSPCPAC